MTQAIASSGHSKPRTLGDLKRIPDFDPAALLAPSRRTPPQLLRVAIEKGETLFPGVHGYEDTVIRKSSMPCSLATIFILLGLRGQQEPHSPRPLNLSDPKCPSSQAAKLTTIP